MVCLRWLWFEHHNYPKIWLEIRNTSNNPSVHLDSFEIFWQSSERDVYSSPEHRKLWPDVDLKVQNSFGMRRWPNWSYLILHEFCTCWEVMRQGKLHCINTCLFAFQFRGKELLLLWFLTAIVPPQKYISHSSLIAFGKHAEKVFFCQNVL